MFPWQRNHSMEVKEEHTWLLIMKETCLRWYISTPPLVMISSPQVLQQFLEAFPVFRSLGSHRALTTFPNSTAGCFPVHLPRELRQSDYNCRRAPCGYQQLTALVGAKEVILLIKATCHYIHPRQHSITWILTLLSLTHRNSYYLLKNSVWKQGYQEMEKRTPSSWCLSNTRLCSTSWLPALCSSPGPISKTSENWCPSSRWNHSDLHSPHRF